MSEALETKESVIVCHGFSYNRLISVCEIDQSDVDRGWGCALGCAVALVDDQEGGSEETQGGLRAEPVQKTI